MKTILTTMLLLVVFTLSETYAQRGELKQRSNPSSMSLISDYYNEDFQPFKKGTWFTKLAFSLSDKDLQNASRIFDQVEDGQDTRFSIDISGGHFIKDHFMLGAKLGYSESKFSGDLINLDSDRINKQSLSRGVTVSPFARITMPLIPNNRLSFYNDFGLSFTYGKALEREVQNFDEIEKRYSNQFAFGAGISPGISFFAVENFAIEAGANLIGYRLNLINSTDGQGVETKKIEHDVNFKLNILSLNIGATYYF